MMSEQMLTARVSAVYSDIDHPVHYDLWRVEMLLQIISRSPPDFQLVHFAGSSNYVVKRHGRRWKLSLGVGITPIGEI